MSDRALASNRLWQWSTRGAWLGPIAFVLSLLGTELLPYESLRSWAVLLLLAAAVLAVLAWSDARWSPPFPAGQGTEAHLQASRTRSVLAMLAAAVALSA